MKSNRVPGAADYYEPRPRCSRSTKSRDELMNGIRLDDAQPVLNALIIECCWITMAILQIEREKDENNNNNIGKKNKKKTEIVWNKENSTIDMERKMADTAVTVFPQKYIWLQQ